jgi:alkylated DNA repair dioxygenase AlkB
VYLIRKEKIDDKKRKGKKKMETVRYKDNNLNILLYPHFLTDADFFFRYVVENVEFAHPHYTQKGVLSKRRNRALYGCISNYIDEYKGETSVIPVINWDTKPIIKEMAKIITKVTKQEYHVCFIQWYNNGEVGIKPHRDKEMKSGTIIASISLGETRTMRFENNGKIIDIPLKSGSLCLINPPTNDYWLHSILKDDTTNPRVSMIFRNCENML